MRLADTLHKHRRRSGRLGSCFRLRTKTLFQRCLMPFWPPEFARSVGSRVLCAEGALLQVAIDCISLQHTCNTQVRENRAQRAAHVSLSDDSLHPWKGCNTLQHTATHCNTHTYETAIAHTERLTTLCCTVLQCVAARERHRVVIVVAVCCSVLQLLQCLAVRCSARQEWNLDMSHFRSRNPFLPQMLYVYNNP